eukprot:gene5182-5835_t
MPGLCRSLGRAFARRKTVDTTPSALDTQLRRCLSTVDLTLIGIGSTLGSGVYVLTGDIAKNTAGPGIAVSFFIAAFASILAGICYAEFGARVPKAGSAYVYTYTTVGELAGFIVGWNLLLEYAIGSATVAKGLSSYLDATFNHKISHYIINKTGLVDVFGSETYLDFFAFSFSLLVSVFVSMGVKNTSILNNVCTFVNIIVIVMVITIGAFYCEFKNWDNYAPFGASGIISGASSCFFAFIGFDVIATTGEEAAKPSKAIPISIVGTITICFLAYFGVAAVVTLMVPYYDLIGDSALTRAFDQNGNQAAKYIISVGALIGLTGTNIVSIIPMPRLLYSMANDGLIFKFFAKVSPSTGVPVISTIISGVLVAVMAFVVKLHDLVEMVSIGTLIAYTFVVVSILLLRYHPEDVGLTKGALSRNASPPPIEEFQDSEDGKFEDSFNDDRAEGYGDAVFRVKTPPFDESIENENQSKSHPTDQSYFKAKCYIVFGVLAITGMAGILTFALHDLESGNILIVIIFSILALIFLIMVISTSLLPQNQQKLYFKVPFLPWLPFMSIFFNIYLMLSLNKLTWLRFAIWMTIGFLVYFCYGIFHSSERRRDNYQFIEGETN